MKNKILLIISFFYLSSYSYTQELIIETFPEDYQLFARDKNNIATVLFSGNILSDSKSNKVLLRVYKDGLLFDEKFSNEKNKKFNFSTIINAGMFLYRFELYHQIENENKLSFVSDNVVCGDAYIITGQSNSHASSKKSIYSSPFARSFGVKTGYEKYTEQDKKIRWGLATGNCKNCKGEGWDKGYDGGWFVKTSYGVGIWGMELAKLLIEKYNIPVSIINGGSGSSTIEENMLYPEKISLETSFGRLAYRVDQAGLKDNIRAIFYHQGESDSYKERSLTYSNNFDILNKDWKRVYKSLEKIYLFQIHQGCGGDFQSEIRETQNQISKRYDHIEIMSTTGVIGHDGCHFSYEGYKEFARLILPLVSRDLFKEKQNRIITPPQLINAYYSDDREITLDFDQPVEFEKFFKVNGVKHLMKNQFFFNNDASLSQLNGVVKSIVSKKNQIILKLNNDQKYSALTWLPNKEYLNTKDIYNGPWIRGINNQIGALTFNKREIKN